MRSGSNLKLEDEPRQTPTSGGQPIASDDYGSDSLILAVVARAWVDIRIAKPVVCIGANDKPIIDPILGEHTVQQCGKVFIETIQGFLESDGPMGAAIRAIVGDKK